MFYFISWLILLCATTTQAFIDDIVDGVSSVVGSGTDAVSSATGIDIPVDDITDTLNYVKDIKEIVEDIDEVCGAIPGIKTVTDAIKTTADAVKTVADTIEDTTDTIKDYVDDIKDELPTVGDVVDGIKTVTDAIEDTVDTVKDTVNTVKNTATSTLNTATSTLTTATSTLSTATDILGKVEELTALLENPLSVIDVGDDIKDFANTLAVCFEDIKSEIPGVGVVNGVLNIPDSIRDLAPFDPEDILFYALAVSLLPLKPQVEYVCFDTVPLIVSMIEGIIDSIPSNDDDASRRRLWEFEDISRPSKTDDKEGEGEATRRRLAWVAIDWSCRADYTYKLSGKYSNLTDTGFEEYCVPAPVEYAWDTSDGHKEMIRFLSDGGFTTNDEEGGHNAVRPNIFQRYRLAQYVLKTIIKVIEDVAEIIKTCSEIKFGAEAGVKCGATGIVHGVIAVLNFATGIMDFAIESADYHDAGIIETRVAAIFHDRKAIIHNQLQIRYNLYDAKTHRLDQYLDRTTYLNGKYEDRSTDLNGKYENRTIYLDDKFVNRTIYLNDKYEDRSKDLNGKYKNRTIYLDDKYEARSTDLNGKYLDRTTYLDNAFNVTLKAIATLQATVDSLPNLNGASSGTTNGNGNGNGGRANAEFGEVMDGVNDKPGDEELININLQIKPSDLYIIGGCIIGFNVVFIGMTVGLILKCCYVGNSGYRRVVKYDTETDIEQK